MASPEHVAIIMDGNGRWAESRGLTRFHGHSEGAKSARTAVESAIKYKVRYLTLYSFSSENWKRPQTEINDLMGLLRSYLENEMKTLVENGIRLRVIGERADLGEDIVQLIQRCEEITSKNKILDLFIALSYGGRYEITEAARQLAIKVKDGNIESADINEEIFSKHLYTWGVPDPDLIIRTSGEKRVSNFLLWQLAYSELVFSDTLWPDFSENDFKKALSEFSLRDRRFGS
ncbi:MAG: di-trans,poly-cis-decaprenylcistransferase [Rhodospirillaceae bacterium]|nr:di-trans,poly-cis-decaprenylcistransferase [Rhodospirillaceae bacterium]